MKPGPREQVGDGKRRRLHSRSTGRSDPSASAPPENQHPGGGARPQGEQLVPSPLLQEEERVQYLGGNAKKKKKVPVPGMTSGYRKITRDSLTPQAGSHPCSVHSPAHLAPGRRPHSLYEAEPDPRRTSHVSAHRGSVRYVLQPRSLTLSINYLYGDKKITSSSHENTRRGASNYVFMFGKT